MPGLPKGGPLGALYKLSNVSRRVAARLKRDKLRKQLKKEEAEGTGPKLKTEPAPPFKSKTVKPKKSVLQKQKVNKKAKKAVPTDYQNAGGVMRDFGSPNQYVTPKEIRLDVSKLKPDYKPVKNNVPSRVAKVAGAAGAGTAAAYAYESYVGRNSQD